MSDDISTIDPWEGLEIHTKGRMITAKCQKCGKYFDYLSNYKLIKFCPDCQVERTKENQKKYEAKKLST